MSELPVNVLVVFYSRYGTAEQLALAAGVGALQGRANIRLRRLADDTDPAVIDADPAWKEHLAPMRRDYVTPRPDDPVWADVVVLVTPADSLRQMNTYLASLRAGGPHAMAGRIAAPLASDLPEAALATICGAAANAGFIVVPVPAASSDALADARAHGRRVALLARSFKSAAS